MPWLVAMGLLASFQCFAQMPDAAALERARQQMQEAMARMRSADTPALPEMPRAGELATQPLTVMPRIAIPSQRFDMDALMQRSRSLAQALQSSRAAESSDLLIFVTLDMPSPALRLLTEQAARAGGVLLIRGLRNDSMRQTLAEVREVLEGGEGAGKPSASWRIDPESFRRFGVMQSPTFVLSRAVPCTGTCKVARAGEGDYLKVAGDVSLDYALEAMARHDQGWRDDIDPRLARLRATP